MSLLDNLKKVSVTAEELTSEKPKIVLLSDNSLTAENYNTLKLFGEKAMILTFEDFDLYIDGENFCLESFSPLRIKLLGNIEKLTYVSKKVSVEEV